jgi:hypothetical protein
MKKRTINEFNILYVNLQVIFTVISLVCLGYYIFTDKALFLLEFSLGITLMILAFNNYRIYERKVATLMYLIVGIISIILGIISVVGLL